MNSKKKILLLYPNLKPGGAAKLMVQMANILSRNGYGVFVCFAGGVLSTQLDKSIHQIVFNFEIEANILKKIITYIKAYFFIIRIIKEKNIKTVINHHRYFSPVLLLIKRTLKVKVIFNAAATFKKKPFVKGSFFGDKVIAVSLAVKNHLVRKFGVDNSIITTIYNGVEPLNIKSEKFTLNLKQELGVGDKAVVSCIGHFRDLKRQDFLLKAWKLLITEQTNCHLILLGFGETEKKLKNFVRDNELEDSVTILVDSHNPEDILNISQVFVLPSEREGLPLAILEAFSLGLPSVGTDTSGINEVIEDGVNGFLFEMNSLEQLKNSIKSLLNDRELYDKCSLAARSKFIENFSIDKYSDAILKYLKKEIRI